MRISINLCCEKLSDRGQDSLSSSVKGREMVVAEFGHLRSLVPDEAGQGMVEYALLIMLVALAVVAAALPSVGTAVSNLFTRVKF